MTVNPRIKLYEKLSTKRCYIEMYFIVNRDRDTICHHILKTPYGHNRVAFRWPTDLFIFCNLTKRHYIHFKVVVIVFVFIVELLFILHLFEMIRLQYILYPIKVRPLLKGYRHIQIICPSSYLALIQ